MSNCIFTTLAGTAAQFNTAVFSSTIGADNYMPDNVLLVESDTLRMKVSKAGVQYADLDYVIEEQFTAQMKALVDGANTANNLLVLSPDGIVPSIMIPDVIGSKPIVVTDIVNRDAIPEAERTGLIIVKDASDDTSVTSSSSALTNGTLSLLAHYDNTIASSADYGATVTTTGDAVSFSTNKKFGTAAMVIPGADSQVNYALSNPINANDDFTTEDFCNFSSVSSGVAGTLFTLLSADDAHYISCSVVGGVLQLTTSESATVTALSMPSALTYHHIVIQRKNNVYELLCDGGIIGSTAAGDLSGVSYSKVQFSGLSNGAADVPVTVDEARIINGHAQYDNTYIVPSEAFPARKAVATYLWDGAWTKISEAESMDVDFSDFVMQGNSVDRLISGTTYVQYTPSERTTLAQTITSLSTLSSYWSTKVAEITNRFDTVSDRQVTIEARLVDVELSAGELQAHVLRTTDTVDYTTFTANNWN